LNSQDPKRFSPAGCRLTAKGIEVAQMLVPSFVVGPNEQDKELMKERGRAAAKEKEETSRQFMASLNAMFGRR
jgi:hypothetical protein